MRTSRSLAVTLRKEGQVELSGETPNATWRGAMLRSLPERCQRNCSQGRRLLFALPHGNEKVIYEIKSTANS